MLMRKVFELIADVMRETRGECEARGVDPLALDVLTGKLCLVLKRENAAFDADRFRDACALREGERA